MRFLVDAQLQPALARRFEALGHVAEHVFDLDLTSAADSDGSRGRSFPSSVIASVIAPGMDASKREQAQAGVSRDAGQVGESANVFRGFYDLLSALTFDDD